MLFNLSDYPTLVVGDVVSFRYDGETVEGVVEKATQVSRSVKSASPFFMVKRTDGLFRNYSWNKVEGLAIA